MTRFLKECNISQQCISTAETPVLALRGELELLAAKDGDLGLQNATLQKELETSFEAHVEAKADPVMDLRETCD